MKNKIVKYYINKFDNEKYRLMDVENNSIYHFKGCYNKKLISLYKEQVKIFMYELEV